MKSLVEELKKNRHLTATQYKSLLQNVDLHDNLYLAEQARHASTAVFGTGIFIRGLIEISNHCRNNCLYCGIRAENPKIRRYRLNAEQIMECCRTGYAKGFRTFVLQGGEDTVQDDAWVENLIRSIKAEFPDCAITLSLGEKSEEAYGRFKKAGADRYLLRHETFDAAHYAKLHPAGMSRDRRLACLHELRRLSYQTGTGIMVGSPYQSVDNIVSDLLFIQDFRPEMVGIGPFIHQKDTPFADFEDGSVEMTLKLISILRLMNPHALIPTTTSLATLAPDGRKRGILAGANVLMPNLTPPEFRNDYALYEGKAVSGAESYEGLDMLENELQSIGYRTVVDRGDYYLN